MAFLRWVVTCQRVLTDQQTNFVSYVDAVEGMSVPELPGPMPPFTVGTLWDRETVGEAIEMRVRIMDPDRTEIARLGPATLYHAEAARHRANVNVFLSRIEKPGYYTVVIEQLAGEEWQMRGAVPIELVLQDRTSDDDTTDARS